MLVIFIFMFGLTFGSFVNALVWRIYMQENKPKRHANNKGKYSILHGRSMCPSCGHTLSSIDLIPVFSWLSLGGKCRYCHMSISWQYPFVELLTACLFLGCYVFWPAQLEGYQIISFIFWLVYIVGFMALAVYDIRWYLLPNRVIFPLMYLASLEFMIHLIFFDGGLALIINTLLSILVGGGIFWALFQISDGKWIGGGDVKLGFLIGTILADPAKSLLFIFTASLIGTLVSLPLMALGKAKRTSHLPFGPFLLVAAIIVYLFGASMISWYKRSIGL